MSKYMRPFMAVYYFISKKSNPNSFLYRNQCWDSYLSLVTSYKLHITFEKK